MAQTKPSPDSTPSTGSAFAGLLSEAAQRLLPLIITAGSLVGFVAFAGAVIVWTRFQAINVPPDQAVKAMPQEELVATGSSLLLIFGFFGVLALLASYLVDRCGRATPGMIRWLLVLLGAEGVAGVILTENLSPGRTAVIAVLFLFPVLVALLLTFVPMLTRFEDELPARDSETLNPKVPVLQKHGKWMEAPQVNLIAGALACGAVAAGLLLGLEPGWGEPLAIVSYLVGAGAAVLALVALVPVAKKLWSIWARRRQEEKWARKAPRRSGTDTPGRHRPQRFYFRSTGVALVWGLMLIAVTLPAVVLAQFWVAISLAVAVVLTGGLWRIAVLEKPGFMWFGLAVFLSVPLFGTLTLMARNLAHPQVQPMALIRSTDGPDEAMQGLYVTEGEDRIYFANISSKGCQNKVSSNSGRLLWVPKSEVVAMSLGPLESVEQASKSALEMSYALTPNVETRAGTEVSLTNAEKRGGGKAALSEPSAEDHRLENAGPAVLPNFGAGLRLTPEEAAPGEVVTLTMSAPKEGGFGRFRSGKTLRLGGVKANVVKVTARSAERAEFVETRSGRLLRLERDEPYVYRRDTGFVPLEEAAGGPAGPQYLKLAEGSVIRTGSRGLPAKSPIYLELDNGPGAPVLAGAPVVSVGERPSQLETAPERLQPHPLSQAWYRNRIEFEVPENAESGLVTVECHQLAGQPLLRVDHAPKARIVVKMEPGSARVTLDGSHSSDEDGRDLAHRWTVAGLRHGHDTTMSADLPPRLRPYAVTLTVTDQGGHEDSLTLRLLRFPATFFPLDQAVPDDGALVEHAARAMARAAERAPPAALEIIGHADDTGGAHHNMVLSLQRAHEIRDALLPEKAGAGSGQIEVPVTTIAYGESCPLDPRGGMRPRNRRVDVFVLEQGVRIIPPAGCHPGRLQTSNRALSVTPAQPTAKTAIPPDR